MVHLIHTHMSDMTEGFFPHCCVLAVVVFLYDYFRCVCNTCERSSRFQFDGDFSCGAFSFPRFVCPSADDVSDLLLLLGTQWTFHKNC